MLLPHERYIKYLIMSGQNPDTINSILLDLSLAPVSCSQAWETLYRVTFESRVTKEVKDYWRGTVKKEPKGYDALMKDLGMGEAYQGSKSFRQMLSLAENEPVSQTIQMLMLKQVDFTEISALVGAKFKLDADEKILQLFEKYLFNVRETPKAGWKAYYELATDNLKAFLLNVFRNELETLKVQHGLPAKLTYTNSLQELHVQAMCRVRELMQHRHPESDKQARAWAMIAIDAGDRYEKYSPKDMANFGKELQLTFDYVKTSFPTITELVNGTPSPQLNAPTPIMEDEESDGNEDS